MGIPVVDSYISLYHKTNCFYLLHHYKQVN
jgi:hypothetical protein